MGISSATLELLVQMKDEASKGLDAVTGALGTLGTAGLAVAAAGVAAFGDALAGGVEDAQNSRRLMAETEQLIKNTGAAAGVSADEVADMASAMSDAAGQSLFGDDTIQQAENVLLKFKEIKVPLVDVTQLSVDMAQALGGAPADAAKTLGLALQNPFDAAGRLAKQGIVLSDSQQKMLASMQKAGDTAGAQKLLVDALNATYGGQAAAAAKAAGGMVQFKASIGETFETLGSKLLPVLDQFGAWLNSPEMQTAIGTFAENLGNGITIAVAFLTDVLLPALGDVWSFLQTNVIPILATMVDWLKENLPPAIATLSAWFNDTLLPALNTIWAFIQDNIIPIIVTLVETDIAMLKEAIRLLAALWTDTLWPALQKVWIFIRDNIIPIIASLIVWFKENLPPTIRTLAALWTGTLLPAITAVYNFVNTYVMPVLNALAEVFNVTIKKAIELIVGTFTTTLIPAFKDLKDYLVDTLLPKLQAVVDFFNVTMKPAFDAVGAFIQPVIDYFGTFGGMVSDLITNLGKLASTINSVHLPAWAGGSGDTGGGDTGGGNAPSSAQPERSSRRVAGAQSTAGRQGDAGGATVRIIVDAGELKRLIKVAIDETLSASGASSLTRVRTGN